VEALVEAVCQSGSGGYGREGTKKWYDELASERNWGEMKEWEGMKKEEERGES
jgi:hypothetical protein